MKTDSIKEKMAMLLAEAKKPTAIPKTALLIVDTSEIFLAESIKLYFKGLKVHIIAEEIATISHLNMLIKKYNAEYAATTQHSLLERLFKDTYKIDVIPKISNYAGSVFVVGGIEVVILNPLEQLNTVVYGRFLCKKYISKLLKTGWRDTTKFEFSVVNAENAKEVENFSRAIAIAFDIETVRENLRIVCVGFSAIFATPSGELTTKTVTIPLNSEYNYTLIKNILSLPVPKITQGGDYDIVYLLRYGIIPVNWMWDTLVIQHCWYSELPKDLGFLSTMFLRNVVYWKDLSETSDTYEYYRYNSLDCWATANIWITQMLDMPEFARHNYELEFPVMFPCILSSLTGILRDSEALEKQKAVIGKKEAEELAKLRKYVNVGTFNPSSPKQVKALLDVLGCQDIQSTQEMYLSEASFRHPINGIILSSVLEIRGLRKLSSTYLCSGMSSKDYKDTVLYKLKPYGTDTGRLASSEHAFWTGTNIQNIPRGREVKKTMKAPYGFFIGECDLEQAETRDTGYIVGEDKLIEAVEGDKDFHSLNCSAFFGVPYNQIYSETENKVLNKPLRQIAKKVNHGANYNMGPAVLVLSMGLENIYKAKKLLNLPISDAKEIAKHLLAGFHRTYEKIGKVYYPWIIRTVTSTNVLTSRALHHTEYNTKKYKTQDAIEKQIESQGDWTRYCFGMPNTNKLVLNSYIAHCPQSLNARTLNEAYIKVFYELALKHPKTFRLHAQIHDSILFSYSDPQHPQKVKEFMEIPVTVKTITGKLLRFTVPAGLKLGMKGKDGRFINATYWSDTE